MARIPKGHTFVPSCCGERYRTIYKANVRKDGIIELIEDGKEDLQEKYNSMRDVTDMSYILKQMSLGDTSVLNRSAGVYGDFTKMPKTMAEAMQLMIDAERAFLELPLDIRNNFDNDYQIWLATAGEEDWSKKMNFIEDKVVEEVKENVEDVS